MIDANVNRYIVAIVESLVREYGYQIAACWRDLKANKFVFECEFRADKSKQDKKTVSFPLFELVGDTWNGKDLVIKKAVEREFAGMNKYRYCPYTRTHGADDWSKPTWTKEE